MIVLAGVISLLALAAVVVSLGYLHLEPTGLSPVRNAVSQYGITSFRAGYRVATIAFGLSGVALASGVDRAVSGRGRSLVVGLLVGYLYAYGDFGASAHHLGDLLLASFLVILAAVIGALIAIGIFLVAIMKS